MEYIRIELIHLFDPGVLRLDVQCIPRDVRTVAAVEHRRREIGSIRHILRAVAKVDGIVRRLAGSCRIAAVNVPRDLSPGDGDLISRGIATVCSICDTAAIDRLCFAARNRNFIVRNSTRSTCMLCSIQTVCLTAVEGHTVFVQSACTVAVSPNDVRTFAALVRDMIAGDSTAVCSNIHIAAVDILRLATRDRDAVAAQRAHPYAVGTDQPLRLVVRRIGIFDIVLRDIAAVGGIIYGNTVNIARLSSCDFGIVALDFACGPPMIRTIHGSRRSAAQRNVVPSQSARTVALTTNDFRTFAALVYDMIAGCRTAVRSSIHIAAIDILRLAARDRDAVAVQRAHPYVVGTNQPLRLVVRRVGIFDIVLRDIAAVSGIIYGNTVNIVRLASCDFGVVTLDFAYGTPMIRTIHGSRRSAAQRNVVPRQSAAAIMTAARQNIARTACGFHMIARDRAVACSHDNRTADNTRSRSRRTAVELNGILGNVTCRARIHRPTDTPLYRTALNGNRVFFHFARPLAICSLHISADGPVGIRHTVARDSAAVRRIGNEGAQNILRHAAALERDVVPFCLACSLIKSAEHTVGCAILKIDIVPLDRMGIRRLLHRCAKDPVCCTVFEGHMVALGHETGSACCAQTADDMIRPARFKDDVIVFKFRIFLGRLCKAADHFLDLVCRCAGSCHCHRIVDRAALVMLGTASAYGFKTAAWRIRHLQFVVARRVPLVGVAAADVGLSRESRPVIGGIGIPVAMDLRIHLRR